MKLHAALLAALWLLGCATVPETGRTQLMLLTPQDEVSLGESAWREFQRGVRPSRDPLLNEQVSRVGRRIAAVAPAPLALWEFLVVDDPTNINAAALPGGKVVVYTGMLTVTRTDAGLAAVLGHEVAHVVARHGAERLSHALLHQLGADSLSSAMRQQPVATRKMAMSVYGLGSDLFGRLPHSRRAELEADELGMIYMARAGYDPREAIAVWERMAQATRERGGAPPEFLSTHPSDQARIARLWQILPRAQAEYRPRPQ